MMEKSAFPKKTKILCNAAQEVILQDEELITKPTSHWKDWDFGQHDEENED